MTLIKSILKETNLYYQNLEKELLERISRLPKGTIKKRKINGRIYYYLQYRQQDKIKHKYLGKEYPENTLKQLVERKILKERLFEEMDRVKKELKMLDKINKQEQKNIQKTINLK